MDVAQVEVRFEMNMQLSTEGRAALYRRECPAPTFQPVTKAYWDSVGKVWTIWCGITGPDVYEGLTITQEQGAAMEASRGKPIESSINAHVKVPLSQNQFDTLYSFAWNEGTPAFESSTLLKKLNAGQYDLVPSELKRWNEAGGQVSPGLVNRRNSEIAQWTGTPFVAGGAHAADVPKPAWRKAITQFHTQLKAAGVSVLGLGSLVDSDTLKNAGAEVQGLAAHSHAFVYVGLGLIVLGIAREFFKARQATS